MNSSNVNKLCSQRTPIDVYIPNFNKTGFYSNDLVATNLSGACQLKVCGENGIRLVTGEWMNLPAKTPNEVAWMKDLSTCPSLTEIQDVSLKGIMNHLEGTLLMDDSYRLCIESKEKFMTGEAVTRFDIARIAPALPIGGPVYRKNGERIEVGYSEYALLRSPGNSLLGGNSDIIGYDTVNNAPVIWKHWVQSNSTIREGPNGITTVGRYLINPLVSLTSPGLYRHILEQDFDPPLHHPNLYEGPMGHLLDIEFDPKMNPKVLTKVISHWWGSWSFVRWFYILLASLISLFIIILIKKYRKARKPGTAPSVLYQVESKPLARVGVPTRI